MLYIYVCAVIAAITCRNWRYRSW